MLLNLPHQLQIVMQVIIVQAELLQIHQLMMSVKEEIYVL
jgi:hypothetical protein